MPLPIPLPIPIPGQDRYVTVVINGGRAFPQITQPYYIRYRPGMTVYQALLETGVVQFSFGGQIVSVSGVFISNAIRYTIRLNGRPLPPNQLYLPLQPGDAVGLELYYV
ncbi:hypothetical protein PA598K_03592 [Paenibacillus sp. 598K]|nr:hypothetical protein PA598K_03592 [Paenibacillus sp. 598K]